MNIYHLVNTYINIPICMHISNSKLEIDQDLNCKSGIKATEELYRSDFRFTNQYFLWLEVLNYEFHNKK